MKCKTCSHEAEPDHVRCSACLVRRQVVKRRHYAKRHARRRIRGPELDARIPLPPREPRPQVTHCKHGHERTPENVYVHPPQGKRKTTLVQCKPCILARVYAARAAGYVR